MLSQLSEAWSGEKGTADGCLRVSLPPPPGSVLRPFSSLRLPFDNSSLLFVDFHVSTKTPNLFSELQTDIFNC